jgi:hypothetical protein
MPADVRDFQNLPDRTALRIKVNDGAVVYGFLNGVRRLQGVRVPEGAGSLILKVAEDGSEYVPSTAYEEQEIDVTAIDTFAVVDQPY